MSDLEVELVAVGARLDHPDGDELIARVRSRCATAHRRRRATVLAVAAAVTIVVATALPQPRAAIADWLRIGGVEIRSEHATPDSTARRPVAEATTSSTVPVQAFTSVTAARPHIEFDPRVPDGDPAVVSVDRRVPGGMLELDYGDFAIAEFQSPTSGAFMTKVVDPQVRLTATTLFGRPGMWLEGAHTVTYLDRDGTRREDTTVKEGNVLLYSVSGITYRIEGPPSLDDARRIAESMHGT